MQELGSFIKSISDFNTKTEIDKVSTLAYYFLKINDRKEFTIKDVCSWFDELHLAKPNTSRLQGNIIKSKNFIKGTESGSFKLHANVIDEHKSVYPSLGVESDEIVQASTEILPESLYRTTRGYIEVLAKQINLAYECNISDGCAVLMRRLLEILLILSYINLRIDGEIKNAKGEYEFLDKIIDNAKVNPTLKLSRNSKSCINTFRELGNFAAHRIEYNTRKGDIKPHILEYRALIEELLYKSGIRV